MKHSKIAIVIGTKAELIKCVPIMVELQKKGYDYWFIHTGQHPLGKISEEFGVVKKPDFILSKEPEISTKFWSIVNRNSFFWNVAMVFKIRNIVKKLKPKYVVYHGDTMSTADAAIGTSRLFNLFSKGWHNVHLEAGLRSGSLLEPFPEEISRQICDRFSDTLLAVSEIAEANLKKSRKSLIRGNIFNTGNTIIDSALIGYDLSKGKRVKKEKEKYALINIHRHEHLRSKKNLKKIIEAIKHIKIRGIWPLHDNTELHLKKYGLMEEVKKMKNIEITPLKDYFTFISLLANCEYLVADGGSIQEESLVFKKPCIILRNVTERPEGLTTGINFLTKLNVEHAKNLIEEIESGKFKIPKFKNPYGEPGLSKKIVERLLE